MPLSLLESLPADGQGFFQSIPPNLFDEPRPPVSISDARFCMEAAALAYKPPEFQPQVTAALAARGWTSQWLPFTEVVLAVLLQSERAAVLAFRGTRVPPFADLFHDSPVNLKDLAADAMPLLLDSGVGGRVHMGFLQAYRDFARAHEGTIAELIGAKRLFLTGHSLGAALATIAARHLGSVNALFTFGSPRVGDEEFRFGFQELGIPVYRFVNSYDLVTTVPLMEMRYTHLGDLLHLNGTTSFAPEGQPTLPQALLHDAKLWGRNIQATLLQLLRVNTLTLPDVDLPEAALLDHAPENYRRALRNLPPPF